MSFIINIHFRVFDRDHFHEYTSDELPMVYCIKQRVKLLTGNRKRTTENGLNQCPDTTIFKEISIDNGNRLWIYKYLSDKETRHKSRRYGRLFRTMQII